MSAANLADRIRMNQKSRSPVQDEVDKLYDDITDAIARGCSFRAIFTRLTREGHNVGKRYNSLWATYQVVKRRRDDQPASSSQATGPLGGHLAAEAVTAGSVSSSSGQMPMVVTDSRRKIDEW